MTRLRPSAEFFVLRSRFARALSVAAAVLCLTFACDVHAQGPALLCDDTTATVEARANACLTVARQHPGDDEARVKAGNALRWADRSEEAIEQYQAAIHIDEGNGEAHHGLAHVLSRLDRDDEALREFRLARALLPDDLELWYDILWLLDYLERSDTVAIEVAALRKATPDSAPKLKAAGDVLYEAELYAEALPFFERALALDTATWVHHTDLAYTLTRLDKRDEAITAMLRGLNVMPADTAARREFASYLYNMDEQSQAIIHLDTLARLAPYSPDPLLFKGEILLEMGQTDLAREAFEAAVSRDPTRGDSHYSLGNAFLELEDLESARDEYAIAARLDSLDPVYHNDLGFALEQMGRLDTALVAYRRAWELDTTQLTALANVVQATARVVSADSAKAILAEWIARDSVNAQRELFRAQIMLQLEDGPGAVQSAERTLGLDSTAMQGHMLRALGYMLQEKLVEADSALARGLAQDSTSARMWALRGLLHSAQEQHTRAMEYWNRVVSLDPSLLEDANVRAAYEASRSATAGANPEQTR